MRMRRKGERWSLFASGKRILMCAKCKGYIPPNSIVCVGILCPITWVHLLFGGVESSQGATYWNGGGFSQQFGTFEALLGSRLVIDSGIFCVVRVDDV